MDLKTIAEKTKVLEEGLGLNFDDNLNKLTQELGEFNDAVQKYRGRYCREKSENNEHIKEELGDLVLNLISVCLKVGINPNELNIYAENTLNKFNERKEFYRKVVEE